MIYLIPLIIIIISILHYDIGNNNYRKKEIYITIVFFLWAISALSYRLGVDVVNNYMPEYDSIIEPLNKISSDYLFETHNRQWGWMLLLSITKTITPSFDFFKAFHALIINFSFGYIIYKYFKFKFTALLCYYIYIYIPVNFEILREALAISFFLLSTPYFLERKFIKYYLLTIIAFSFHISAFILFLFPLTLKIEQSRFVIISLLIICVFSLAFVSQTQELFYYLLFIESVSEKANYYFSSDTHGGSNYSISNIINYFLNIIAPMLLILKAKEDDNIKKFAPYIIVYVLIYTAATHISIFFRFNNYFNIIFIYIYIQMFYSKHFLSRYNLKSRKIFLCIAILFFCILKFKILIQPIGNIPGYYRYYPYSSIIDKNTNSKRESIYYLLNN